MHESAGTSALSAASKALQAKTSGSVTLMQIQCVSSDTDGSFCDFAWAEPVAINVFPVCPSYMTVPCRIGSLPHLDTAAQEDEKSSLPPKRHWDEEGRVYKQQLDRNSGLQNMDLCALNK